MASTQSIRSKSPFLNKYILDNIDEVEFINKNSESNTLIGKYSDYILKISCKPVLTINNPLIVEQQIYEYIIPKLYIHTPFLVKYYTQISNKDVRVSEIINKNNKKTIDNKETFQIDPQIYDINEQYILVLEKTQNKKLFDYNLKENQLFQIIFQVLWTLMCFDRIKMKHNDLHLNNIMIDQLDEPITLYFEHPNPLHPTENKIIELTTRYIVKIFDFDRSTVYGDKNISRNISLDSNLCKVHGYCNYRSSKFDLWTFLYSLSQIVNENNYPNVHNFIVQVCDVKYIRTTNQRIKSAYENPQKNSDDFLHFLTWKYQPLNYKWMKWEDLPLYKQSELSHDGWNQDIWDNFTYEKLPSELKNNRYVDKTIWNSRIEYQVKIQLDSLENCFDILATKMNSNIQHQKKIYTLPKKVSLHTFIPKLNPHPERYKYEPNINNLRLEDIERLKELYNYYIDKYDVFKLYDYELSLFDEDNYDWKTKFIELCSYLNINTNSESYFLAIMLISCSIYHQIILDSSLQENEIQYLLNINNDDLLKLNKKIKKIWTEFGGVLPIKLIDLGGKATN